MTTATPNRRDRLRTATVAEIKETGRRQLVEGGATAISLRAIAREMGMTAPAIYRYFPSLDALIMAIVTDLFEELRSGVEAAATTHADEPVPARLAEMARAFRRWSREHPPEFALMFGNPVPGVIAYAAQCSPINDAGARLGETFFTVMNEYHVEHPLPDDLPDMPEILFRPYIDNFGDRFPLPVIFFFVSAWTRLYGIVAMEVFGHLQWAMSDAEPLFERELEQTLQTWARYRRSP